MPYDAHIISQTQATKKFLLNKFNYNNKKFDNEDSFMNSNLKCILSIKIWNDYFEKQNIEFNGAIIYIEEIISNLNQSLILSLLGFKIPAYVMIRRSQENILSFFYYKDHQIEFLRRESEANSKNSKNLNELKEYIIDFPYTEFYKVNSQIIREFVKNIIKNWKEHYQNLSHYVHGSNSNFYDMFQYLEEINMNEEELRQIEESINTFSSIFNALMIVFFKDIYNRFEESEKSLIRKSIDNHFGFKSKIIEIFGNI